MAKKKKKQKPHKTSLNFKTIKFDETKPELALMTPFTMFDYGEHDNKIVVKSGIRELIGEFEHTHHLNNNQMKTLMSTIENEIISFFDIITMRFIECHECDDDLNIYNVSSKINTHADILDFTEYEETDSKKDILSAAMNHLALMQPDETDISLLWSTNEYIHIRYSPSVEYAIKRLGYDDKSKSVSYEIIGLEHRLFDESKTFTIPSFIAEIMVGLINEKNIETSVNLDYADDINVACNKEIIQWIGIKHASQLISGIPSTNFVFPAFAITKLSYAPRYTEFANTYINRLCYSEQHNDKNIGPSKSIIKRMIQMATVNVLGNSTNNFAYLRQKVSIAIACIVLTNAMLSTEKLSSPQKTSHKTIVTYATSENKQPDAKRKTRHLGKIKISSEKRPSVPTMRKIINYSMAEWSRRGFTRHYKNGKTVFIKPTTVKRRCIDITTTEKAIKQTEYIIHSENNSQQKDR